MEPTTETTAELNGCKPFGAAHVRIFFCAVPTLAVTTPLLIFGEWWLAGLAGVVAFSNSWFCTEARPERGESYNPNAASDL
jgi:hypothetical protein